MNGKCTSPNLCECDIGYSSVTQYECEPLCNTYCTNGFCARPNECSCNAGYELTESKLYCLPVCTQDCANRNAHCTEPNRCTCNWGYRQSDIDADLPSCTPICEIPCVNGNCTEPNVCTCNPGYEEDIDRFVCKPKCERICLNGKCTAPNVCTCDPGYQLNENGECEPNCTEPCVMGTCIAPDVCSCYPGYGLPDDSRYVCEAVCEKACVNGTCTAPDVCTCHDGYRATGDDTMSHVCEPVCELPCEPRGHCAAPNTCNCIQGYRMIDMTAKENEVSATIFFLFSFFKHRFRYKAMRQIDSFECRWSWTRSSRAVNLFAIKIARTARARSPMFALATTGSRRTRTIGANPSACLVTTAPA